MSFQSRLNMPNYGILKITAEADYNCSQVLCKRYTKFDSIVCRRHQTIIPDSPIFTCQVFLINLIISSENHPSKSFLKRLFVGGAYLEFSALIHRYLSCLRDKFPAQHSGGKSGSATNIAVGVVCGVSI
jgi:hypothetical protein